MSEEKEKTKYLIEITWDSLNGWMITYPLFDKWFDSCTIDQINKAIAAIQNLVSSIEETEEG